MSMNLLIAMAFQTENRNFKIHYYFQVIHEHWNTGQKYATFGSTVSKVDTKEQQKRIKQ